MGSERHSLCLFGSLVHNRRVRHVSTGSHLSNRMKCHSGSLRVVATDCGATCHIHGSADMPTCPLHMADTSSTLGCHRVHTTLTVCHGRSANICPSSSRDEQGAFEPRTREDLEEVFIMVPRVALLQLSRTWFLFMVATKLLDGGNGSSHKFTTLFQVIYRGVDDGSIGCILPGILIFFSRLQISRSCYRCHSRDQNLTWHPCATPSRRIIRPANKSPCYNRGERGRE
ncbi:hypothetical protein Micbo1qcDRAFT_27241 [Microdochium bolleyi]|uniref:Uncharacterized protein n=1 Tax=Microdochium bolleyi TaxID=196109 RepID=A0A136JEL5_9PEZI|nr:hypothetical protein Micbo1qcDRAFT_27241 [Microdochium bolleyi]